MDEKDRKILDILKEDGRESYTEIAEEVGVSEGTVRNRVERMQENDVIEKFTVETSSRGTSAVIMVELETGKDIENTLEAFPEDIEIMEVAGKYDLVLRVQREENSQINSMLDEIRSIEGIKETETYMVLNQRN
jgi:DNA-binding Lrp family transcriptional regulator